MKKFCVYMKKSQKQFKKLRCTEGFKKRNTRAFCRIFFKKTEVHCGYPPECAR